MGRPVSITWTAVGPEHLQRRPLLARRKKCCANGHNYDDVTSHVWEPYRFTPGTGPGQARADRDGREITYQAPLPAGEELAFQLEPTRPGSWSGLPPEE